METINQNNKTKQRRPTGENEQKDIPERAEKKEKLVIDGNAFYELDLECLRTKQKGQRK